jgi:uncharacterized protein YbdZ (MbtH family)
MTASHATCTDVLFGTHRAFADGPAGWTVARPEGSREDSVRHVEQNWTDMRPEPLIDAVAEGADAGGERAGRRG